MSTDDETLKRDKEILTHIQHRYDEEERRFQTVDSKISSMIANRILRQETFSLNTIKFSLKLLFN